MSRLKQAVIRPSYSDEESGSDLEPEVSSFSKSRADESDDELATLSFGSLSSAQKKIEQESRGERKSKSSSSKSPGSSSSSAQNFRGSRKFTGADTKKKSKHAPSESSSKAPVSKVREIEGLGSKYKDNSLYRDIRFDAAYGKADLGAIRKNYAFLDEYREQELSQMKSMLKDKKSASLLSNREREDIEYKVQSLKSRLDTMKNRDLETKILTDHKKEQLKKFKDGSQTNPYFLKKSDKRKLIQKAKFDTMRSSQREKVMERKRKRRLGKEFRELEFNQNQSGRK
ncbi:rRNA biogenesis protein Rrp36p [[Candida] railenensis]|uniref:rRNA biogenesis protein RRP36 n=1 Tax=[Candida] railenensis TaxID=45579 RepID=A0A9P0QRY8_9ASCO|nr:rRNA biogenesis protein Rrp36p [[Candida] railenensis]